MKEVMILLRSSDGNIFEVEKTVIQLQSKMIKNTIDDGFEDSVIPLPKIKSATLTKVIEYCKRHAPNADTGFRPRRNSVLKVEVEPSPDEELNKFDEMFVDVSQDELHDLIIASNYLEINTLLELTCKKAADMIKGKTVEEIRQIFNLVNDYTPEEEEEFRRQNAWAFQ